MRVVSIAVSFTNLGFTILDDNFRALVASYLRCGVDSFTLSWLNNSNSSFVTLTTYCPTIFMFDDPLVLAF